MLSLPALFVAVATAALGYALGAARRTAAPPDGRAASQAPQPPPDEAGPPSSEPRWRQVIDSEPEGLALFDAAGRLQHINAAGLALLGIDQARDAVGRPFDEFVTAPHRPAFAALVESVFRGESSTLELEIRSGRDVRRWVVMRAAPLRDDDNRIVSMLGVAHDVSERKRAEGLLRWEKRALELIVQPGRLDELLDRLVTDLEGQAPDALCSVLLLDESGRHLRRGSAPSLPAAFSTAIDGVAIGPRVGSCGTAAYLNRQVIVSDVATDPLWADYRDLALAHGLRACWSTPIRSDAGAVLGTFAVYYREERHPSRHELELIERAEKIVAIAVMRKQGESALREQRNRLELALEGGDLGVWEWFPQTGQTTHSAMWARLLEYEPSEFEGTFDFFAGLVHPDDLPLVTQRLQDHLAGRTEGYQSQHRLRTRSGGWKWVFDRGRVVRSDEHGPVLVSGVASDITALKEAEAALQASQERYEVAVLGSSDGLWDWDMRTNATYFSPRWKAMLGYGDGEIANDYPTWESLLHPDDLAPTVAALQGYLAGEVPAYQPEFRMRAKDGTYRWILARGAVLRDGDGRPVRMAGSHTDITARKENEEALRASQRVIQAILDAIPVRVFWKDRELRYLGCNSAFARDAGFVEPKDIIGRDDYQMGWRDQADLYRAGDLAVIESGAAKLHVEEPQSTPDGQTITLLTSKVPLHDSSGQTTGVLGTYLDISERKRAEEEVRRLNSDLEATVRARTAELQASEAQLRDIFDGTSELIQSVDRNGRILFTNRAWRDTLGYTEDEAAALNIFDIVHESHREHCAGFLARLMAGEDAGVFETVLMARDGRPCLVEGSVSVRMAGGEAVATRAILRDVTARKAVDRALRESEEKYRLMIQSSRDAILTLHPPDWHFTSCNAAAVELLGAADEAQVCATAPWALSPEVQPDGRRSADGAREHIERAVEAGSASFEWVHTRLDGTPFTATVLLSRVVQVGHTYLLATLRDITQQKQSEAAMKALNENLDQLVTERTGQLRESEERFRVLVDAAPSAVIMAAPDGRITFANRRAEAVFGYRPEELVGRLVETLLPESQRAAHARLRSGNWTNLPPRALGRDGTLAARRKDGSDVPVEVGLTPVEVAGRTFMMATVTDITARKQAEDAVKRLAAFPEVNPNPVIELDAGATLTYSNVAASALARALGLDEPRAMLPPDVSTIVRECLASGQERLGLEYKFGRRVLSWSFYPIAGRGVVHAYAAEVTERLALEAQLRQSQKMEAIGQLAGGVAHDFNNILSVVMMQAEVSAAADDLPDDTMEGLREIQSCAERGADLTKQLLFFSRRQVMQPRDLDVNDVVTALAKMLQRIIGEDVRLELHLHTAKLPARADAGMLNQVLLNLAVNARDAMPKGGRLRVETWERVVDDRTERPYPDIHSGRYVGFSVTDTGGGIAADVLPRIFEPFFTTKEAGRGTGLGLATVFGIVRQHGGWLNVASEVGRGATFDVYLPASVELQPAAEPRASRPAPVGGTETLLVVEDEASVRSLVRSVLERRGYAVLEASNGVEALKVWAARRDAISLVFTDMVMPEGISGQELARRLRAEKPDLRVVFSSGYSPEIAGRELKLGTGENFLQKPFTTEQLLDQVRQALDATPTLA
ncbi:MAG: PAS domain S-box protein [Vicinamibacterales bacterium]